MSGCVIVVAVEATPDQCKAFGAALAMRLAGVDRGSLLKELGVTRNALQRWLAGSSEPERARVFLLEKLLEQRPGALSKHLGYLPLDARDVLSVEDAIADDSRLTTRDQRLLVDLYRSRLEG